MMALVQLHAYGASDVWYMTSKINGHAIPYNMPAYNYCCFIDGEIDTRVNDIILRPPETAKSSLVTPVFGRSEHPYKVSSTVE